MPKRSAVIVGINKYDDGKIPELTGAENDARDIYERLKDPENPEFDFDIPDDHYLIGKKATCKNIRKALSDVFWKTDETCDLALFYFSGHGIEAEYYGEGYIAPCDMIRDDPLVCGIKMSELKQVISDSVHACAVTILDCCYSGLAITKGVATGDSDAGVKFDEHVKDFADFAGKEGRAVLASSGEDQPSREIVLKHEGEQEAHPHGAFTFYLVEGMDNGMITLTDLNRYVDSKVKVLKKQQCKFYAAGESGIGDIIIVRSREEKFKTKIQKKLEDAKNYCESDDPRKQILAIDIVQEILKINAKNDDALKYKNEINVALTEYKKSVDEWIEKNTLSTSRLIQDVFPKLEELSEFLDFDRIMTLKEIREKTLLVNLCRVSTGKILQNAFEEKIRQYLGPKKEPTVEARASQVQKSSTPDRASSEKIEAQRPRSGAESTSKPT